MAKTELEPGDKIRVKNWANDYEVEIERVTKTMAVSKPYNDTGAVLKFRLGIGGDETVWIKSQEKWQTTTYTLIKPKQQDDQSSTKGRG